MIVTCPSCATRYELSEAALAKGRKVRCKQCRHVWYEAPTAAPETDFAWEIQEDAIVAIPEEVTDVSERSAAAAQKDAIVAEEFGEADLTKENLQSFKPEIKLDAGSKPVTESPKATFPWEVAGWLAVAGLAAVFVCILILGRDRIAGRWPEATNLYAGIGMKVGSPSAGLELRNFTASFKDHDSKPLLTVAGEILNTTAARHLLPPLHIRLRDSKETVVTSWTVSPRLTALPPHGTVPFQTELAASPEITSTEILLGR